MTLRPIDPQARRIPQSSGLLPCLYIPIAARDTNAIATYVGTILGELAAGKPNKALLVESHEPENEMTGWPFGITLDRQFSIIRFKCG
jgi:hypothetical protein